MHWRDGLLLTTYGGSQVGYSLALPCIVNEDGNTFRVAYAYLLTEHSHDSQRFLMEALKKLACMPGESESFLPGICKTVMTDQSKIARFLATISLLVMRAFRCFSASLDVWTNFYCLQNSVTA